MIAAASIVAVAGPGGVTRLPVLASQVPLVLRRTPDAVFVVGGAAGPMGGDELALRISVGAGAFLRVRTAAASIALPGPDGLESVLRITVDVGAGGRLEYLPEPVVVSAVARHATIIRVTLAEGASLLLRDEVLLGRHGEAGGASRTVLRVITRGGRCSGSRSRCRGRIRPCWGRPCWPGTVGWGRCCWWTRPPGKHAIRPRPPWRTAPG